MNEIDVVIVWVGVEENVNVGTEEFVIEQKTREDEPVRKIE